MFIQRYKITRLIDKVFFVKDQVVYFLLFTKYPKAAAVKNIIKL